ncbi:MULTISPECIES: hypothetical protein [Bartonella]|nr:MULTISPECIES: hypothetical protein [Bartonella]
MALVEFSFMGGKLLGEKFLVKRALWRKEERVGVVYEGETLAVGWLIFGG